MTVYLRFLPSLSSASLVLLLWSVVLSAFITVSTFRVAFTLLAGLGLALWPLTLEQGSIQGRVKSMAANLKLAHATDFTTIEQQFLTLWNALQDAGSGQLAFDLLFAGLNLEHFVSTLDHDPTKRTAEEQTIRDQLNATFQAFVAQANAALAGVVVSKGVGGG